MKDMSDDNENRRNSRVAIVVASTAIIGALCTMLYRFSSRIIDISPEKDGVHWYYFWGVVLSSLSSAIFFAVDIVLFIVDDLKRYNILDMNYKQFDTSSDRRYRQLIVDFRILVCLMVIVLFSLLPVKAIMGDIKERMFSAVVSVILCCKYSIMSTEV